MKIANSLNANKSTAVLLGNGFLILMTITNVYGFGMILNYLSSEGNNDALHLLRQFIISTIFIIPIVLIFFPSFKSKGNLFHFYDPVSRPEKAFIDIVFNLFSRTYLLLAGSILFLYLISGGFSKEFVVLACFALINSCICCLTIQQLLSIKVATLKWVANVANGCKIQFSELKKISDPAILHVLSDGTFLHYIVWYGAVRDNSRTDYQKQAPLYLIGDPARGLLAMSEEQISAIWESQVCLVLTPNEGFVKSAHRDREKIKWFKNLIHEDIGLLAAAAVLGLVIVLSGLTMAIFSQNLIDHIIPSKNHKKLFSGLFLVTFILLIRVALEALRSYILLKQSQGFNNRIIADFQRTLLGLPKLFFDYRNEGDLIARMNDTARIQQVIGQLAGQVLADTLVVVISGGALFFYSWQVAVTVLLSLPFYFLLIYSFHRSISEKQRQVMSNYALTEGNYISTLRGIAVIKSFDRKSIFEHQNKLIYGNYQVSIFELGLVRLRLSAYASMAGVLILMTVLAYISYDVFLGELKAGQLIAILGICSTMLPSVAGLALLAIPVNEARIAIDRMFEFADIKPEGTPRPEPTTDLSHLETIALKNVSFRFAGRKMLLHNINISISKGEIVGIVGASGSGKSSLIQILERFYAPASGKIEVNDTQDAALIPLTQWRRNVASVPQDVHLFNGTVLDNIVLGHHDDQEHIASFFENVHFKPFLSSLPQGIHTLVGNGGIQVSGGQKQWIGLMRAVFAKPQLLLLDESTAAMDMSSEISVMDLLKTLRCGMAIVYVSHRLHTLPQLCDKIYVLEQNTVVASGTHYDLLLSENSYSRFWENMQPR
ncbi:ATP-binding cassette, subfamily B [Dyadobacter soli]|uniref:ATP-binding cassette, subfamily B n=1 Tax=Dyadobacter soli TaxID=659014 RepID=A0A1G7VBP4_9BACT|nr:ABC transporter transmembrane domain-containing protein [Dyadobacter soli]SDG57242.1 ATP-binding cassette, subfamily B [Dyadobacter soli]